jgi:hypothetical protein
MMVGQGKERKMPTHLSQIIAIEKDHKDKANQQLQHALTVLTNSGRLTGIARSYTPIDENGIKLPGESTRVQVKATQVIKDLQGHLVSLFDVVATKDWANCEAKADVVVDSRILIKDAPATYLLFLEKQLAELLALVKKMPVLDPSFSWEYDQAQDCWITEPTETIRTKKSKKAQQIFEGNQYHKPEFVLFDIDEPEGTWKTLHYSGAMPQSEINAIQTRIEILQRAVKFAREAANRQEVVQQHVGQTVLHYLFG